MMNLVVDHHEVNIKPLSVSAFVCRDRGLIHWEQVPSNFNAEMLLAQVK